MNKKGFELQFHWIFVLIAGGLILAFFFGVAQKQRTISEERLSLTLATDVDSIFTGAIVSTGTAQLLPVPRQGIAFSCTEGCDCSYSIQRASKSFNDKPLFAPAELSNEDLTVWSLDWEVPYRATNFLYVTNSLVKYYFVHSEDALSRQLLGILTKQLPDLINYEVVSFADLASIQYDGEEMTTFVFLDVSPQEIDGSFRREEVRGVSIDAGRVTFFEKPRNTVTFVPKELYGWISPASLYAAVFSDGPQMYACGMKTAFKQLSYVAQLYSSRAQTLQAAADAAGQDWCVYLPAQRLLDQQYEGARQAMVNLDEQQMVTLASLYTPLEQRNRELVQQSCPELF